VRHALLAAAWLSVPLALGTLQGCAVETMEDESLEVEGALGTPPADKSYRLPWKDGVAHSVTQPEAGGASAVSTHRTMSGAWDFDMVLGEEVLAMHDGTVVDVVTSCADQRDLPKVGSSDEQARALAAARACGSTFGNHGMVLQEWSAGGGSFRRVTMYAHLGAMARLGASAVKVQVGDLVKAGDPLGRLGMTGYTTGPHLHVHTQKDPVTPAGERSVRLRDATGGRCFSGFGCAPFYSLVGGKWAAAKAPKNLCLDPLTRKPVTKGCGVASPTE
jgi:hypothetical protein